MATLAATRYNLAIAACYGRLRAAGKPAKVALTACMRTLLAIPDALVRRGTPWAPAADRAHPQDD